MQQGDRVRIIKEEVLPSYASGTDALLDAFNKLTESSQRFLDQGWTPEEVFWSRYFWIRAYAVSRQAATGPDAGLEQFVFKVLESPSPACAPDWGQLEAIDRLAGAEALRF